MILTLPPAYIGGSLGVEFVLSVACIRLSALGRAFFRSGSACLTCRFCSNCSCVKPSATSLDKTLKNHMGKIRKECLVCNVCLPECSPLIGRLSVRLVCRFIVIATSATSLDKT